MTDFFGRLVAGGSPEEPAREAAHPAVPPPPGLTDITDGEWFSRSYATAEALAKQTVCDPESFGAVAQEWYWRSEYGVALVLFGGALDSMHTLYVVEGMRRRQPSVADVWLAEGFTASVGAALALHPEAPVDDEVRTATHRLRTTASLCERVGISSVPYRSALDQLTVNAPFVWVEDILWH